MDALFRQYEQPICTYLARLTGDLARAQELTQETFIRAYRALLHGAQWDNPRAWLYRVASRLATDDYRRRSLLQWLPLLDTDADPEPQDAGPQDAGPQSASAEQLAVRQALATLGPRYRIPLVLYVTEGYSVQEVADVLAISVSAVKMRLCRARQQFRRAYEAAERDAQQEAETALGWERE